MLCDNPQIKYENSAPPSDYESEDDISIFFSFPRPQSVVGAGLPNIDYSLIHPSLLGIKFEENIENIENEINKIGQENVVTDVSENIEENLEQVEQLNEICNLKITTPEEDTTNIEKQKKKEVFKEKEKSKKVKDKSPDIIQKEEHVSTGKKKRKRHKHKKSKRAKSASDSDERNVNNTDTEVIFKLYLKESETTAKYSDSSKSSKHSKLKHLIVTSGYDNSSYSDESIKSNQFLRKAKEYRNIYSDTEQPSPDRSETSRKKRYLKSPKTKVKKEIFSDDNNCSNLKNPENSSRRKFRNNEDSNDSATYRNKNQGKRCSDDDNSSHLKNQDNLSRRNVMDNDDSNDSATYHNRNKGKRYSDDDNSSYFKNSENLPRRKFRDNDGSNGSATYHNRNHEKRYSDDDNSSLKNQDNLSRRNYRDNDDSNDSATYHNRNQGKRYSDDDNSSYFKKSENFSKRFRDKDDSNDSATCQNRSHGKRYSDDDDYDRISEHYSPKRKRKLDIKQEFEDCKDGEEFSGSYYCIICKLTLNSESTWQSHKLGKRHAKAKRAQAVHEVVKSSLLPSTSTSFPEDGNRHDIPKPGMKRIELKGAVSSIQRVCDDLPKRQLIGLKHVWEIREKAEISYYCNLCDAPCSASSIGQHVVGYKHRLNCLKEYFPDIYERYKDSYKKKVERIMEDLFYDFRREKVRVFEDIPIHDYRNSSTYPNNQPGPSWQVDPFPATKQETLVVKDENGKSVVPSNQEFLNTSYADFHCIVCDSHMNNIAMWEAHVRGKRHLKNTKKAPQGIPATNKYVLAPKNTKSYLKEKIKQECEDEIVVGLNYIRENQGKHGNQYNCFLCGGCCSDIDIIPHILSMKHKLKYLEKLHFDGDKAENGIMWINSMQVSIYYREQLIDGECRRIVGKKGEGEPQIYYLKRDM